MTNKKENSCINLFLDENIMVGGFLRKFVDETCLKNLNKEDQNLIEDFKKSKIIISLIEDLFKIPTRIITTESILIGTINKIRYVYTKKYKTFINSKYIHENIKKIESYLNKRKMQQYDSKIYHIKFDNLDIYIIKEDEEEKYQKEFDKKYEKIISKVNLEKIFDNGDINLIKTFAAYSENSNKKRKCYNIIITSDSRIVRKLTNITVLKTLFLNNKLYISSPRILLECISSDNNFKENLYIASTIYIFSSCKKS